MGYSICVETHTATTSAPSTISSVGVTITTGRSFVLPRPSLASTSTICP
jgi:hypothetical protein